MSGVLKIVGLVVFLLVLPVSTAQAQQVPRYNQPDVVIGETIPGDNVQGVKFTRLPAPVVPARQSIPDTTLPESSVLPFTGAELTGFLLVGLMAVGAGSLIVRRTRSI